MLNKDLKVKVVVVFLLEISSYNLNKLRVQRTLKEDCGDKALLGQLGGSDQTRRRATSTRHSRCC